MPGHLLINDSQIALAAEEMIGQHGSAAYARANDQIRDCRSQGFDAVADAWVLIRDAIAEKLNATPSVEAYMDALDKGVLLSE